MKVQAIKILCQLFLVCFALSCHKPSKEEPPTTKAVEIKKQNGKYQLYRNGTPYFIKGAGGYDHFDVLKKAGGNSIRIWSTDNAQEILDKAAELGLTVTVGIKIAYAKSEIDYNDKKAVAAQKERIRQETLKYKDHPALLMWGIGNEPTLHLSPYDFLQNSRTWAAIDDIAKMVHELDPHHPTTTMLQDIDAKAIFYISRFCKDIDVLSINIFRPIKNGKISDKLKLLGWNGPFILSEYGNMGYWAEEEYTDWHALHERSSTEKFKFINEFYQSNIEGEANACLGSYIFFWGQKHEYTSTWLSLFTESGKQTEVVDGIQYLWTKQWPSKRAPYVHSLHVNKQDQKRNIYLHPNANFKVDIKARDYESAKLELYWEIISDDNEMYFDATYNQIKPEVVGRDTVIYMNPNLPPAYGSAGANFHDISLELTAPTDEGPYRLFIYLQDDQEKVATANATFYVTD